MDKDLRCEVTLQKQNLYMCLTCGKIFAGGQGSPPILDHYFKESHFAVLSLEKHQIMVLPSYTPLPDNPIYHDIIFSSHLTYTPNIISIIDKGVAPDNPNKDLSIIPGALNFDMLETLHPFAAVIRFIAAITPLRNQLLLKRQTKPLALGFSNFFRKYFNPYNFRNHISPMNLLHIIEDKSKGKFPIEENIDPSKLLTWLISSLDRELKGFLKEQISGKLEINENLIDGTKTNSVQQFFCLPIELTDSPLYRSGLEKEQIIPKLELTELLKRYDGATQTKIVADGAVKVRQMRLLETAPFLWINANRIVQTVFERPEKLNAYVQIPPDFLDLSKLGLPGHYRLAAVLAHEGTAEAGTYVTYTQAGGGWVKGGTKTVSRTLFQEAARAQCCHLLFEKLE